MFAAHYKLDNLTLFIDKNGLQIDGTTDDVMNLGDVCAKFAAFGWHTQRINGHDFVQIENAVRIGGGVLNVPKVIVCDTIKGKGVSFMENRVNWHGAAPKAEEYEIAVKELV